MGRAEDDGGAARGREGLDTGGSPPVEYRPVI
jgi:hypothetical protein